MADYATPDEIAAFAQEFEALSSDGQEQLATAASRLFDNLCQVEENFFAPAAESATDKVFYGDETAYLKVGPYVGVLTDEAITIVDDDDESQDVPEYFEENGYLVVRGYGQGVPIRDLFDARDTSRFLGWPRNFEITVNARWGFEAVPADVKQAVTQLAIHLWRMGDPAFTAISNSGQPYQPPAIPNQVREIADRYRDKYAQSAVFA